MADVFRAYKFLNQSLGLQLSDQQITSVEREWKMAWAKQRDYGKQVIDPDAWEFFSYLVPRLKKIKRAKKESRRS